MFVYYPNRDRRSLFQVETLDPMTNDQIARLAWNAVRGDDPPYDQCSGPFREDLGARVRGVIKSNRASTGFEEEVLSLIRFNESEIARMGQQPQSEVPFEYPKPYIKDELITFDPQTGAATITEVPATPNPDPVAQKPARQTPKAKTSKKKGKK